MKTWASDGLSWGLNGRTNGSVPSVVPGRQEALVKVIFLSFWGHCKGFGDVASGGSEVERWKGRVSVALGSAWSPVERPLGSSFPRILSGRRGRGMEKEEQIFLGLFGWRASLSLDPSAICLWPSVVSAKRQSLRTSSGSWLPSSSWHQGSLQIVPVLPQSSPWLRSRRLSGWGKQSHRGEAFLLLELCPAENLSAV